MNTKYNDKLLYIKNRIRKAGAKKFALIITKLIERDKISNPPTQLRRSMFKSKYS